MNKQKGTIGSFELVHLLLAFIIGASVLLAIGSRPKVVKQVGVWKTIDIKVLDIDPPKHFTFDYIIKSTGEVVRYSTKHCSAYSDSKGIKVGNEYTVKIKIDTLTYKDGTTERVLQTDGCDLMEQIK